MDVDRMGFLARIVYGVRGYMAYIDRRPGRNGVYVYYTDKATGKIMQLPRAMTKHLDGKPPAVQQKWLEDWEKDHGMSRDRSVRIHLREGDKLLALWEHYQTARMKTRKRRDITAEKETQVFEKHIVPFFVGKHSNKRPETWHPLVPAFHSHLYGQKMKDSTLQKILWALDRFGRHLVFTQSMTFPYAIQTPATENKKITPLKVRLSPEEVIEHVRNRMDDLPDAGESKGGRAFILARNDYKLAVLLGYFAGLSPSELCGVEKEALLTAQDAEEASRTLPGFRAVGLGTRLALSVTKTLGPDDEEPVELTKNDYRRAVVNIWYPDAAVMIAKLVAERPAGRLFPLTYDGMFQAWRKRVMPKLGATMHDLRRASALYLGRTKRIPTTLLMEHMRHAEIETTMLYIREPSTPERTKKAKQDFDDIL
jgi:integrase